MIAAIENQPAGSGTDLVQQVAEIFGPTGLLSKASNFEFRPEQQQMAVAVARALEAREHLVVEAGTGVGKSLAYLIPSILFALAKQKKAVVCTHTINLQEQLTQKDLPMLAAVLGALPEGSLSYTLTYTGKHIVTLAGPHLWVFETAGRTLRKFTPEVEGFREDYGRVFATNGGTELWVVLPDAKLVHRYALPGRPCGIEAWLVALQLPD